MPAFLKKKEFWGTVIAVILLAYCLKDVRAAKVSELIDRVNFYYLIPALAMEFILVICRAIRWRIIVEKTKKIRMLRVIPLYSAGQVINIVMPILTGQIGRLLLFSKKEELSKTYVFSTILIEVLFDAISLLIFIFVASMAFVFPSRYRSISYIIAIVTVSLFVLLYLILQFKDQISAFNKKNLRDRWPGAYITLRRFSRSFTRGIALLRSTQYFIRTLVLSLISWVAHIMVIYFLFMSFGFELPVVTAVVVMVINTIALMIPITPGNAGTFEFAVKTPLLAFGQNGSDAALYALALHLLDLIPIFVMGLFFLRIERVTIREIKEEGEKEEIPEEFVEETIAVDEDSP